MTYAGLNIIEKGAVVSVRGRRFTVTEVTEVDSSRAPDSWPEHQRRRVVEVAMTADDDGNTYEAVLPLRPDSRSMGIAVLAPADEEGHYAVCVKCGDPFPCTEVRHIRHAGVRATQLLATIEYEAKHPWPCTWCSKFSNRKPRRFKTERGMKQHLRRCGANPATWDPSRWLFCFDDDMNIRGGVDPVYLAAGEGADEDSPFRVHRLFGIEFGGLDELVAINRAVMKAALEGELPARLEDLDLS